LGAKSSDPSVDNDGNALTTGDQYFNTASNELRVYNGTAWQAASVIGGTVNTLAVNTSATLNYGTANGVTYLNGSKVLTSGSALVFDGTSLAVGGVATIQGELNVFKTGSAPTLYVQGDGGNSTTQGIIRIGGSAARSASIQGFRESIGSNYHALRFYSYNAADQLNYEITSGGTSIWSVGGTEGMRLTSTGLGIGTSSPSVKLYVKAATASADVFYAVNSNSKGLNLNTTASDNLQISHTNSNFNIDYWVSGTGVHTFSTGGSERMRIDSSGNLGLGVTPSAWTTSFGFKALDIGQGCVLGATSDANLIYNAFFNSSNNWVYKTTAEASRYQQSGAIHAWYNAASGTAGNTITFAERMRLDASGNLGIGVTTINTTLHVQGAGTTDGSIKFNNQLNSTGAFSSSPQSGSMVALKYNTAGEYAGMGGWSIGKENATDGNFSSYFAMHTRANGGAITERARIDSSGRLLVGTTTDSGASEILSVLQNNANWMATFRNSNSSAPYGLQVWYTGADPNDTGKEFLALYSSGSQTMRMSVRSNGGIANYSANNVNLSDRREKTNFAPAKAYLDVICAIPVQTFNYIDQNLEEDGGLTLGVVAQDVQAVAPELVMESNWAGKDEEPKMRLSIYQTDLQYALMKCIQEQQALIQSLKARLDAANL
jgi:hypothetical protein